MRYSFVNRKVKTFIGGEKFCSLTKEKGEKFMIANIISLATINNI